MSDVIRVRTGKNFKSHILFKRKTQILACLKTCVHVDKTFSGERGEKAEKMTGDMLSPS